ncbi:alpha-L-fucosidase [Paenibacillus sp. GCM10012307]|uniref:alpha-L-fucosidase n=1 Tax=Paenibacillus roseus TaxID=2798579 RepID=A0A934MKK6_9BACL|nr:alpha-L-fucosidase [Paenibacillus roseus]MBJ6361150.1 alpha-L-fucosidase [Paenibacillus roseus]
MKSLQQLKSQYVPVEVPKQSAEKMQWFRDGKFGMFIHWGLYSLLGRGEWVMFNERMAAEQYAELAKQFDASGFDPKAWARTAKEAGMKYMVLTTKHHDGFALFQTEASAFNSVNSAAGRDLVAEYVEACRSEGLKVGFYYSPMDWRFPGYFFPEMYISSALEMKEQCWTQIRELMSNYGKIDMLWYDGEWLAHGGIHYDTRIPGWITNKEWMHDETYFKVNYFWESERLNAMVRELQPDIMINNRSGWEGDFVVRERSIGEIRTDKPWDSCDCLADSWGWMPDRQMLSLRQLVDRFIRIVTRDGTFLLNVGPQGAGEIEAAQAERLKQMGDWLARYGESVYGTRGGPFLPAAWGGSVYRDSTVYLHITEWVDDTIVLRDAPPNLLTSSSLTSEGVTVSRTDDNKLLITVPEGERHPLDTIIVLQFKDPIKWEGHAVEEQITHGLGDGLA